MASGSFRLKLTFALGIFSAGVSGFALAQTDGAATAHTLRQIITLRRGANLNKVLTDHKISPQKKFHDFGGFTAKLDGTRIGKLRRDPRVLAVEDDGPVVMTSQSVGDGLTRMGIPGFSFAKIDGLDERFDVDVAVMDSGIDLTHPDLNVVEHINCSEVPAPGAEAKCDHSGRDGDDWKGHGTHVAGIIGALDNDFGVVGIAAGVRLWSVQVFSPENEKDTTTGWWSNILAGVNYVSQRADRIPILNCSFTNNGLNAPVLAIRQAFSSLVEKGVVVVAAAGNQSANIIGRDRVWGTGDDYYPAALPEVLAVTSMNPITNRFAATTNYSSYSRAENVVVSTGGAIDVAAPGNEIYSTWKDGTYQKDSGTSMAAAHVSGLVALYIAANGRAHDAEGVYAIRRAIIAAALPQYKIESGKKTWLWGNGDPFDGDLSPEPLALPNASWIPKVTEPSKIIGARMGPHGFEVTLTTQPNSLHTVECTEAIGSEWTTITTVEGTGDPVTVIDEASLGDLSTKSLPPRSRVYRVNTVPLSSVTKP